MSCKDIPIAICGVGLRLPGDVCTTDDLWDLLVNGVDAKTRVTASRNNPEAFGDLLGGKTNTQNQYGYLINQDIGRFDPSQFSISQREAERCDPQQRILLEVTRECLEDAGEVSYRGSRVGCYIGTFGAPWSRLQGTDCQFTTDYLTTGQEDTMLSNRISYEYDLRGPSVTLNTACSASLTALHLACAALRDGTITSAVVGGACLQLSPLFTEMLAEGGLVSKDGSSKSFDASADGYARSEGIITVYIKPLADALRDGNAIRAVIRGSAINSDGNRAGLTHPQASTQAALIREVYADNGIDPAETAFVECHATGTAAGDPVEAEAVDGVFGDHGVYIGSIKPNIGHCEGAAGLASLVKGVLALEHLTIPPNIKLVNPNPKVKLGTRVTVPITPVHFPKNKKHRVSINSFGIGGSNAHVILDAFPRGGPDGKSRGTHGNANGTSNGTPNGTTNVASNDHSTHDGNYEVMNPSEKADHTNGYRKEYSRKAPLLLLFSASTANSLKSRVNNHISFVSKHAADVEDIAYTLGMRREYMSHRAFAIANSRGRIVSSTDGRLVSSTDPNATKHVAMVFSGQGAQWSGMGKELILASPDCLKDLRTMDAILRSVPSPPTWSLIDLLSSDDLEMPDLNDAELSQPLCTALQILLLHHLRRLGVVPVAVVGHSSGEIAAAYACGYISLQMAVKAAFFRGLVAKNAPKNGCMAAIGLNSEEASQFLCDGVVVACENSPSSTTLSGDRNAMEQVLYSLGQEIPETFKRMLVVDVAYHSPHMQPLGKMYMALLKTHHISKNDTYFATGATFFSSVLGKKADIAVVSDPEYWVKNLEQRVRFVSAAQQLYSTHGNSILLEIGPHSTLAGPLRQIFQAKSWNLEYCSVQKRGSDSYVTFLEGLGYLYQQGTAIDFRSLFKNGKTLSGLPPYPWDHSGPSYWLESRASRAFRFRKYPRHCLLGLRSLEAPDTLPTWRNMLNIDDVPWLADHQVEGETIFPFAGYVAVAGEASRQLMDLPLGSGYRLRHVIAKSALILKESHEIEMFTTLRPKRLTDSTNSAWYEFLIQSYDGAQWIQHCSGEVMAARSPEAGKSDDTVVPSHQRLSRPVSTDRFYKTMTRNGYRYGPEFALLSNITSSPTEQMARADMVDVHKHSSAQFTVHPSFIDNCLQLTFVASTRGLCRLLNQLAVPTLVEELEVHSSSAPEMTVQSRVGGSLSDFRQCQIDCVSSDGRKILSISGLRLAPLDDKMVSSNASDDHGMASMEWWPAINFVDYTKCLRPPIGNRQHCIMAQELTFLCLLDEMERSHEIVIANPYMAKLREWMSDKIAQAQRGDGFALVTRERACTMVKIQQAERQKLIDKSISALMRGPFSSFAKSCERLLDNAIPLWAGERQAIDVLTQGELLVDFYNQVSFDYGDFVSLLAKTNPQLRILEVGAGTGGTTELILRALVGGDEIENAPPPYSQYTFTDISGAFLSKAKDRFSYAPNMDYKVFDASRHPSEQGLEDLKHGYDLVIAANIVHATPFLGDTLTNLRYLLKPEGRLLLTEILPTLNYVNYVFGHFPGWWLGEDDGRIGGPCASLERWDAELRTSGFSTMESVVYDDDEPFRHSMAIVARADSGPTSVNQRDDRVLTLLCLDPSGGLASTLQAYLEREGWVVQHHQIADRPPSSSHPILSCVDLELGRYSATLDQNKFERIRECLKGQTRQILWLMPPVQTDAEDPNAAQFLGLSRGFRWELGIPLYTLEITGQDTLRYPNLIMDVFNTIVDEVDMGDMAPDMEYAVRAGQVLVPRYRPLFYEDAIKKLSIEALGDTQSSAMLRIKHLGKFDSLYWQQEPLDVTIPNGTVEIEVRAAGLNAHDVYHAMSGHPGTSGSDMTFGFEGSGIVRRTGPDDDKFKPGDRVMYHSFNKGLATHVKIPHGHLCRIPDSLTYEEAATVTVSFSTVLHSLVTLGRLQKGQSVLIHSACGGVGLAAIQVCQMIGAEVYVTVSDEEKVGYLMERYKFSRQRIFSSRDTSFLKGVMRETNGVGVDLVLNSRPGDLLHASWKCVAKFGTMIELGQTDISGSGRLDMLPFGDNRIYAGVDASELARLPGFISRTFARFLQGLSDGTLRPIDRLTSFPADDIESAFRFASDPAHIGRAVVTFSSLPSSLPTAPYIRRVRFDPEGNYLLTGGVGGLGRAIAVWMVEKGAKHLTFLSRSTGTSKNGQDLFRELESMGCSVTAVKGSVTNRDDIDRAIQNSKYPFKGVLHLAMVLRDASLNTMEWLEWQEVVQTKSQGAWNLHSAFASANQELDFFFLASSVISAVESSGQANYIAANAMLEAFCQYRRNRGLPASVLNINAIEDVGYVAENRHAAKNMKMQGLKAANESVFLDCLELSLLQNQARYHSVNSVNSVKVAPVSAWSCPSQILMGIYTGLDLKGSNSRVTWRRDRRMTLYHNTLRKETAMTSKKDALQNFLQSIADGNGNSLLQDEKTATFLAKQIGNRVLESLLKPNADVNPHTSLKQLGLDSLLATDLSRWFRSTFGIKIGVLEIVGSASLVQLASSVVEKLRKKHDKS